MMPPDEIHSYVNDVIDFAEKVSLVFFTSNTLTPDIPLENILVLEYCAELLVSRPENWRKVERVL
jgi:hypothetical protein